MSEEVFRWVITIAVGLIWLMTLATAAAALAIYRTSKRTHRKIDPLLDKAGPILDGARSLVDDVRPRVREILDHASEISGSARDQVARLDALVTETTDRARLQIDRIDLVVEDTVNRVQETTALIQNTILKPVREVNGLVSGLRAALSAMARRNRASVDHATQDEEMFI